MLALIYILKACKHSIRSILYIRLHNNDKVVDLSIFSAYFQTFVFPNFVILL
jgi:hypothetical protein